LYSLPGAIFNTSGWFGCFAKSDSPDKIPKMNIFTTLALGPKKFFLIMKKYFSYSVFYAESEDFFIFALRRTGSYLAYHWSYRPGIFTILKNFLYWSQI